MSPKNAQKEAIRMKAEGRTGVEIATALAKDGYLSPRTGKPLTASAISRMTTRLRKRRSPRAKVAATIALPRRHRGSSQARLDAVQKILEIKDIAADERIALLHIMLGV